MRERPKILWGIAAGALWALALVGGTQLAGLPYLPPAMALPGAFLVPGLVLAAMIGRLALRRFFDDALIDGADFTPGSAGWIDQRVLANTLEQLALALAIWPFAALVLGGAMALALGIGFGIACLAFWIGYHVAPPLRGFGFAATLYPTVLAALWALAVWVL